MSILSLKQIAAYRDTEKKRFVFYGYRFLVDALAWVMAIVAAAFVRFDGMVDQIPWVSLGYLMIIAVLLQLVLGTTFLLYRGRHPWGSFESLLDVVVIVLVSSLLMWVWTIAWPYYALVPRSLVLIAAPVAMLLMAGTRYVGRYVRQIQTKPNANGDKVLLYGAGYVGDHLIRLLAHDPHSSMVPVGILDDDPEKRHLLLHGVKVKGTGTDLVQVAEVTGARAVIIAIGDPKPELLERLYPLAEQVGLNVLLMPPTEQMLTAGVNASDLRDLDIEDLLGRQQVDTDVSSIVGYLNGKRVLVTGAGGSIGQQLCAEIEKHGPAELIMLDRDETALQEIELRLRGNGLLTSDKVVLADIRDAAQLKHIFIERKPDVIFHAAALKHLPMLERFPYEAWHTNVLGTRNVLEAARASGVKILINVSTDKAANPTSVLGLSKRLAERLTAWAGDSEGTRYLSVRFGNVLGSRGSILPVFKRLIEDNRALTITHPEVTRYFMTIPESCQLVLQAGAIGNTGEVLILDMGEPIKILDIAKKMIALSGKNIQIKYTGMREGEKLHEDLHSTFEINETSFHKMISHTPVTGLNGKDLDLEKWKGMVALSVNQRPESAEAEWWASG